MTAAAPTPAHDQILTMPLSLLEESPTNRRRTWGNLEELAQSFRDVGVLQPLVARPKGERFELVFGHRRLRAAKIAKLESVPVIVRSLSDKAANEAQVIENLQRQDLHPLEEAEGFEQLHALGWSAEDMAAKIGKSRAYVFQRMQLLRLTPDAREAFYADQLSASVALYVARVPPALQAEALKVLEDEAEQESGWFPAKKGDKPKPGDIAPLPAREAARLLRDRFTLQLAQAPFDRADAELVPSAGPCTTCPKRSGNALELFDDVPSKDVCTDPTCFASKKAAAADTVLVKLRAKGTDVVAGKRTQFGEMKPPAGYVKLDEHCHEAGKTFGELRKKVLDRKPRTPGLRVVHEAKRIVMLDERNKPIEVVKKADILAGASAAGVKMRERSSGGGSGFDRARYEAENRRREQKHQADKLGNQATIAQLLALVVGKPLSDPLLRILCVAAADRNMDDVAARRGWKGKDRGWRGMDCSADIAKLAGDELLALLVECILVETDGRLDQAAKLFKLDADGNRAKALERMKAEAKAEAKVKRGVCKTCGCTNDTPCSNKTTGTCAWTDATQTQCTTCAEIIAAGKKRKGKKR